MWGCEIQHCKQSRDTQQAACGLHAAGGAALLCMIDLHSAGKGKIPQFRPGFVLKCKQRKKKNLYTAQNSDVSYRNCLLE